jgi:SAM-dependent methyltransferase
MNFINIMKNSFEHHTNMISDKNRNNLYFKAIKSSTSLYDKIVEVGSGTGILSSYASKFTKNVVTGIEYDEDTFNTSLALNSKLIKNNKVDFIKGRSFDISFKNNESPTFLICELMGQIGPEENIVECLYDFSKRHPSIRKIMPMQLDLFIQPMFFSHFEQIKKTYLSAWNQNFAKSSLDFLSNKFEILFSNKIIPIDTNILMKKPEPQDEPSIIVQYSLGTDWNSNFNYKYNFVKSEKINAVHLFFKSYLTPEIILSTQYCSPITHWQQSFVYKPSFATTLEISYQRGNGEIKLNWS